jgi:MFS family permease
VRSDAGDHRPLAPLRHANFVFYTAQRLFGGLGMTLLQAVMAWQVNLLSSSVSAAAFHLGLLGLIRFIPALTLSLVGGAVADSYNRRNIVRLAQVLPLGCSLTLAAATFGGWVSLELIYGLVLVVGAASSFENPAGSALLPGIVPVQEFSTAVTLSNSARQMGFVSGPALSGLIIAVAGIEYAYLTHAVAIAASVLLVSMIRYQQPPGTKRDVSVGAIIEGLRFVRGHQALLGAMTLDMFAVIFGGATALLPIYATDILDIGARGYGLLQASFEFGALLMALLLVTRPPVVNTGRALLITVAYFGVGTIVFGLSRWFPLSLLAYMSIGMADQLSVVLRQTTIQLSTPDELRGRVSSVSQVFIGASNQLGAVESGLVAAVTSATFAVVSGGLGCLGVVGAVAVKLPGLRRYRVGDSQAAREAEAAALAELEVAGGDA